MKNNYFIFLLTFLMSTTIMAQGLLQPFKDDVEQQTDFEDDNLVGWTSLDLDGLNTQGPFQSFPGKGGPLGFIVYNPSQTTPENVLEGYTPHSGQKYYASISSWDGPVNDWLISDELAEHPGGVLSFYVRSGANFAGDDEFKVAYSTTGTDPDDFIFFNGGNTTSPTLNWAKFEYDIPAGAKHLAINCVSYAYMMLVDDIEFKANVVPLAPGVITDFTVGTQIDTEIEVAFSWQNPTLDSAGNALTDMTGVKIYRGTHPMNLVEIADLASTAGESMEYVDVLASEGSYIHRFVPYNASGNGIPYSTPITFYGFETTPGAPTNISFTQNASLHTVISWDPVDYGADGGVLEDPVVGYTITRSLGSTTETLVEMHPSTTFTEADIPALNLYTYTITAQTGPDNLGVPAVVSAYSGLGEDQVSVTSGNAISNQPFELNRTSILSQSIYTAEEIGDSGLITSISYFGNLGTTTSSHYKIYMSVTDRETFGTNLNNAVWEFYGDQKLVFDGNIQFPAGRSEVAIDLDQPFFYDADGNQNVIITIIKPLVDNPPNVNPRDFYNTSVEGMRTYYSQGYTVDMSVITTQPAAWTTEDVPTIPSIVVGKSTNYGSLTGTVTLLDGGSPLEDVRVTITPEDGDGYQIETTLTDANGEYMIPALMAGDYVATFTKNTYNTVDITFTIGENENLVLDAEMDNSLPIMISGSVVDAQGNGLEGVTLNLTGFSEFSTVSDASGNFTLEGFADKDYELEAVHPLYITEIISFTSEDSDHTLEPITMELATPKPSNVIAVNNNDVGEVSWNVPVGYSNETMIGWGSFITTGDSWGNGGDPFIAGIRLETTDLEAQVPADAELTHVRAYIANNAEIIIKVYEGANGAELVHSQPASVSEEGWYVFELTNSNPIDFTKELWIGIEFLAGQYGAYPIGLDDGPNAPGRKGSMLYSNGVWTGMSLTNKNWNIYGIVNNTTEANPVGYKVYRSPASPTEWTELTATPITETSYSDATLSSAEPNMYKYGITAVYGADMESEKAVSNEIELNMFFDFTIDIATDFGSAEGAYVSVWNDESFAEAFVPVGSSSVTLDGLLFGNYTVRVELENYEIAILTDVTVEEDSAITVPLNLLKVQPSNLTATIEDGNSARLDWTLHAAFTDEIEKYEDFERQNIGDYILRDVDGLNTYIYDNFTWPNAGSPMSFMVFNPYATTPAVEISAFSGRRFLTGFAGPDGVNNDWLIIPAGSGDFSFMAASLVGSAPERIRVLYSTTGNEASDFTPFEGVINVPAEWTEYSFEAPEDTKYVAINYVGNDTYILKIDDLTYEKPYSHALSYNIYLDGELVSENVSDMTYTLMDLSNGSHLAEVEAVYETGVSAKTEVEIIILGVEDHAILDFKIYPNPTTGVFSLDINSRANVSIIDMQGRVLFSGVKEAGTSILDHNLASGTYIINVKTDLGTSSKKLIVK